MERKRRPCIFITSQSSAHRLPLAAVQPTTARAVSLSLVCLARDLPMTSLKAGSARRSLARCDDPVRAWGRRGYVRLFVRAMWAMWILVMFIPRLRGCDVRHDEHLFVFFRCAEASTTDQNTPAKCCNSHTCFAKLEKSKS